MSPTHPAVAPVTASVQADQSTECNHGARPASRGLPVLVAFQPMLAASQPAARATCGAVPLYAI